MINRRHSGGEEQDVIEYLIKRGARLHTHLMSFVNELRLTKLTCYGRQYQLDDKKTTDQLTWEDIEDDNYDDLNGSYHQGITNQMNEASKFIGDLDRKIERQKKKKKRKEEKEAAANSNKGDTNTETGHYPEEFNTTATQMIMKNRSLCYEFGANSRLRYENFFTEENMIKEYERVLGVNLTL